MAVKLTVIDSEKPALVDDDLADLARYRWKLHGKGHVYREADHPIKLVHAVLGGKPPAGWVMAHANGDRLDCQRENLELIALARHLKKPRRRGARLQTSAEEAAINAECAPLQRELDL